MRSKTASTSSRRRSRSTLRVRTRVGGPPLARASLSSRSSIVVSSTLTAVAGCLFAYYRGFVSAEAFSLYLTIQYVAMIIIGGMGSILGSVVTGLGLGIVEGLTKVYYPQGSATVIFVVMVIVLLARPAGLFGRAA